MKIVTIKVTPHQNKDAQLLIPQGFSDGYARCIDIKTNNTRSTTFIDSDYGDQTAAVLTVENHKEPVVITYSFEEVKTELPLGFFNPQQNRYTEASAGLISDIKALSADNISQESLVLKIIEKAKSTFDYGHMDKRFNDDCEQVPSVCGTTKGSCVDINTYIIAAAKSLNITVQYVAGYWFHPDRNFTQDMHCWLVFNIEGMIVPWDLAHHLKWGVPTLSSGLNPAGGRRVPMSFGRGLNFEGPYGTIQISHFSEPVWLLPEGNTEASSIKISIED